MATDKEKCFEKSLDKYQSESGKDLNIKHRQPWVQDTATKTWRQEPRGFWAGVNSMMKTLAWLSGHGASPGSSQQVRVPDLTVNNNQVVDTKFTRSDGTVDSWGKKPGAGNQMNQQNDYREINQQQKGDPNAKEISLDPESCDCKGRGNPQPVEVLQYQNVPSYGNQFYFAPLPGVGGVPSFSMPGVPSFVPGGGMIPVFP